MLNEFLTVDELLGDSLFSNDPVDEAKVSEPVLPTATLVGSNEYFSAQEIRSNVRPIQEGVAIGCDHRLCLANKKRKFDHLFDFNGDLGTNKSYDQEVKENNFSLSNKKFCQQSSFPYAAIPILGQSAKLVGSKGVTERKSIVRCAPPPPPTVLTGIGIELVQVPGGVSRVLSVLSNTLREYRQAIHKEHDGDIVVEDASSTAFTAAPGYSYKIHFHRGFFSVNMKVHLYQVNSARAVKRMDDENKKQSKPMRPPRQPQQGNFTIEVVYENGEKPLYYDFTQYLRMNLDYSSAKNSVSTVADLGQQLNATLVVDNVADDAITNSSTKISSELDKNYAFYSIPSNQGYLISLIRMVQVYTEFTDSPVGNQVHDMDDRIEAIQHLYSMVKTGSDSMLNLLHSLGLTRAILTIFDRQQGNREAASESKSKNVLAHLAFMISLELGVNSTAKEMIRHSKGWRDYFRHFASEQSRRITNSTTVEAKKSYFSFEDIVKEEFSSGFLQTAY